MDQQISILGRRKAHRVIVRQDVGLELAKDGPRCMGTLQDLSMAGSRIFTEDALEVGKIIRVAFDLEDGAGPAQLFGQVVWVSRSEDPVGHYNGIEFVKLKDTDKERLRQFVDGRMWTVLDLLSRMNLLTEFHDLERMVVSSICFDRPLQDGETLPVSEIGQSLVIVREGTVRCDEVDEEGNAYSSQILQAGDNCGYLPVDPRGTNHVRILAEGNAAVLVLTGEGFFYLSANHPETALKVLSMYCCLLHDRIHGIEVAPA